MPLPPRIAKRTGALLNIENKDDNRCMEWALTAALERKMGITHANQKPSRVSHYQKSNVKLDFSNVSYPTPISEVSSFLKLMNNENNVISNTFI